jgi:hypothetical protein
VLDIENNIICFLHRRFGAKVSSRALFPGLSYRWFTSHKLALALCLYASMPESGLVLQIKVQALPGKGRYAAWYFPSEFRRLASCKVCTKPFNAQNSLSCSKRRLL